MGVEVTPRAVEVLRRAFELGRIDPARVGVRILLAASPRGDAVRTGFAEEPEPGETIVEAGGIRLFVPSSLADRGAVVDASDEHDQIVIR